MPLSQEQTDKIEELKEQLGIDRSFGQALSRAASSHGAHSGIQPISDERGAEISRTTLNPTILKIIELLNSKL